METTELLSPEVLSEVTNRGVPDVYQDPHRAGLVAKNDVVDDVCAFAVGTSATYPGLVAPYRLPAGEKEWRVICDDVGPWALVGTWLLEERRGFASTISLSP